MHRFMALTQKDIAQRLGISLIQVNRALNDHPLVGEKTRLRVQEMAREMGYDETTNLHARTLAAKRHDRKRVTGTLAVLLPNAASMVRQNSYFGPVLTGIEEEVARREQDLLLATYPFFSPPEKSLPRIIREGEVDGVICLNYETPVFEFLHARQMPVVTVAFEHPLTHSVRPDEAAGIALAVEHLAQRGHQRLAYLGLPPNRSPYANRLKAFEATVRRLNLKSGLVSTGIAETDGQDAFEAIENLLAQGAFTGLVCYNDDVAMAAVRALKARGLSVPSDISVTGFDDISPMLHFRPNLTSVDYDRVLMGTRAVDLLLQARDNSDDGFARETVPVNLADGQTVATPAKRSASAAYAPTAK